MNQSVNYRILITAVLLLGLSTLKAGAAVLAPDKVLDQAIQEMITAIQNQQEAVQADTTRLYPLIEDILLPHIDIITTSRLVLGIHWKEADKEQKLRFIREFRNLLVRFYGSALAEYLGDHDITKDMIRFLPLNESLDNKELTVHSVVIPPNGEQVAVHYRMHQTRKGWKVYDVTVSGVSLITTYRSSFDAEIKQKGLDGLIGSLAARSDTILKSNEKNAAVKQN